MDWNQKLNKYCIYLPVVLARGQAVPFYLQQLLKSQYMNQHDLQRLQLNKLRSMLAYAKENVPYYHKSLRARTGSSVEGLAELQNLPFLMKADLKREEEALRSRECFVLLTPKTTGGSTGMPVTIPKTRSSMAWELAATWRGYSWAGIDIGDRQARFWGVPFHQKDRWRARLIDLVANRKRCSAFAFSERDLEIYTRALESFHPRYFYGYVSMLEEYAKFIRRRGGALPFKLQCIIATSEVLAAPQRRLIEETFSTKVFNEYGSGELGSIAHECDDGSLHVSAENMIVEVMSGNRPAQPGEVGELVITELNNLAAPLIRYRTGDFASLSNSPCKCGRTLPVINNLYGRSYDTIRNSEGKLFHGEFMMYIFEDAQRSNLGIQAFQVIQKSWRSFVIKIVPGGGYGLATEEFITRRIRDQFDPDVVVHFEIVGEIPRAASGKMRLIIGMGEDGSPAQ